MKVSTDVIRASDTLKLSGLVALPPDTLYALAADATADAAVAKVYALKEREQGKPLPILVSNIDQAEAIAEFNDLARVLASAFWPGALTLVLPKRAGLASKALAGSQSVALRVPENALALAVIHQLGRPITGTSASISGGGDPRTADDVRTPLGERVDPVLEADTDLIGRSSTIADCSSGEVNILRQGAVEAADSVAVIANSSIMSPDR